MMVSPFLERLIALGLLATLAGLVWLAVVQPLADWRAAQLERRASASAELETLAERLEGLRNDRLLLEDDTDLGLVWPAGQIGAATARVQATLSDIARTHGVSLRSITPSGSQDVPAATLVTFRLESEAHLDALVGFLRDVEFNSPALMIDRATLRRLNRRAASAPGATNPQPLVFAQLDIVAPLARETDSTGDNP